MADKTEKKKLAERFQEFIGLDKINLLNDYMKTISEQARCFVDVFKVYADKNKVPLPADGYPVNGYFAHTNSEGEAPSTAKVSEEPAAKNPPATKVEPASKPSALEASLDSNQPPKDTGIDDYFGPSPKNEATENKPAGSVKPDLKADYSESKSLWDAVKNFPGVVLFNAPFVALAYASPGGTIRDNLGSLRNMDKRAEKKLDEIMRKLKGAENPSTYSKITDSAKVLKSKTDSWAKKHERGLETVVDWTIGLPGRLISPISPFLTYATTKRLTEESRPVFGDKDYMGSGTKLAIAGIGTLATLGFVLNALGDMGFDTYHVVSEIGLRAAWAMPKIDLLKELYQSYNWKDLAVLGTVAGLNLGSSVYEGLIRHAKK